MSHSIKYLTQAKKDDVKRVNVAAIIINHRYKVLLCRRNRNKKVAPGAWHMPGGKVEENETMEQAIARELLEELSIDVTRMGDVLAVFHDYLSGSEKHRTYFIVVQAIGKIKLNPENEAAEFVPIDKISEYLEPERVELNTQAALFGLEHALYSDVVS